MKLNLVDFQVTGFYPYPSVVIHAILQLDQDSIWSMLRDRLIEEAKKMNLDVHLDNKIVFKLVDRYDNPIYIGFHDGSVRIGVGVAYEYKYFIRGTEFANGKGTDI